MNLNTVERLSVTVTLKDRIISIIGLILLIVGFFALESHTNSGVHQYRLEFLLFILCALWLGASVINKISVICGLRIVFLGECAIICFVLLCIYFLLLVNIDTSYEYHILYEALIFFGFLGNLAMDTTLTLPYYSD